MKVTVVGTSCTWFKRNNTSYIIDDDILLDVPEGSYKDIVKNIDIISLKGVLISHLHTDHALDLHIITTRFMRENHGRTTPLKIYAPKGTFDKIIGLHKLFYASDDECEKESYAGKVEFIDIEDGMTFDIGEYNVTVYKVEHGKPESFAFSFKDKNGKVVGFSGDTRVCDNLHKMLDVSNYAFVEMSAVKPHMAHISINEFVELSNKYENVKMFPVHTSDECQEFAIKKGLNYLVDGQELEF